LFECGDALRGNVLPAVAIQIKRLNARDLLDCGPDGTNASPYSAATDSAIAAAAGSLSAMSWLRSANAA
jgi:hypothetical protein